MGDLRTRETSRGDFGLSLVRRAGAASLRGLAVVAALFALLGSAACVGLTGSSPLAPSGSGSGSGSDSGGITATPSSLAFGNVVVGTANSVPVTLSNTGKVDLTISSVSISGKGFSTSGIATPLVLGAGQSADFTTSFKPSAAGAASGQISIESDASPMVVDMSGMGVASAPQLSLSTSSLSFGDVTVGSASTQTVALKNTGNADLELGSVSASGAGFTVSGGSGMNLAPNQSTTIDVTFDPKAAGSITGGLSFSTNATNSAKVELAGVGVAAASPSEPASSSAKPSVDLKWSPSASAVIGYFVYRSTISGGPYAKLNPSVDATADYTDDSVSSGTTYYYVVTSVDSSNIESSYSNQASVTVPSS
jgi:hypothetical protein